jgi:hypothetical protein
MPKDFGTSSGGSEAKPSSIGSGSSGLWRFSGDVMPAVRPRTSRPLSDRRPPREYALGSEVALRVLAGRKVRAVLISAESSPSVREIKFDGDELRKYKAVRYDNGRVFLTKKNAERDELMLY